MRVSGVQRSYSFVTVVYLCMVEATVRKLSCREKVEGHHLSDRACVQASFPYACTMLQQPPQVGRMKDQGGRA